MKYNIQWVRNIISKIEQDKPAVVLAFLDAEKAYDRFDWNDVIKQFGFPPYFGQWTVIY